MFADGALGLHERGDAAALRPRDPPVEPLVDLFVGEVTGEQVAELLALVFGAVGAVALQLVRRDPSPRLRNLGLTIALISAAFVLGAVQRLGLQAHRRGWLADETAARLLFEWQLAKSALALLFAVIAAALLRRFLAGMRFADHVVRVFTEQVAMAPAVSELGLTPRELEVLEVIGTGRLTDQEIAETLHISPHTAHSHVRNIMSKAGMRTRRDLLLLARQSGRV